jgi:hypothetical protein
LEISEGQSSGFLTSIGNRLFLVLALFHIRHLFFFGLPACGVAVCWGGLSREEITGKESVSVFYLYLAMP